MTDMERAFLASIAAAPDEDAPRLVLADWLEERGECERAEFIRSQCLDGGRSYRTKMLFRRHRLRWVQESGFKTGWCVKANERGDSYTVLCHGGIGQTATIVFRRGFVESVTLSCSAWLAHAAAIIEAVPMLGSVRLSDKRPNNSPVNRKRWSWFHASVPGRDFESVFDERIRLPDAIFRHLKGGRGSVPLCKWYDSSDEAITDCIQACLAHARDELARRRNPRLAEPRILPL